MSNLERSILSLYYPQFHSPNNSRFESFFESIKQQENHLSKKLKPLISTKFIQKKLLEMKIKEQV